MGEPLRGWSVADMREWLGNDPEEARLAEAFSVVHAKEGYLMDVSEDDESREAEFEEWWDYQKELCSRIIAIQDQRGEGIHFALGCDAMDHLPEPGDEIDWDEEDGFWIRRAVVSLREWPDEKVVGSGGRRD